ncbi:4-alpha-glucanotransferase, partial [Candidatus Omnitrophota bacterium]
MDKRGSGILLHITSLPSPNGIGDLGPWAYKFVDFLRDSEQSYWQVLPLNPTSLIYGNSPYSSVSAFAGNSLLISPELLVEDKLLRNQDIQGMPVFDERCCDYTAAIYFKEKLLNKAFDNFKSRSKTYTAYQKFCREHTFWLDDFALFVAIKNSLEGKTWNHWPV